MGAHVGIVLKGKQQIEMMRQTGRVVAGVLATMRGAVAAGVTTSALDQIAAEGFRRAGAVSDCKGFAISRFSDKKFPGYTCISVNHEVVQGVPGPLVLKAGDVVSLDVGASMNGWCASVATTVPVGTVSADVRQFLEVAERALTLGIEQARPGRKWSIVAGLIQRHVERHGYGIVREFVGRGVGRSPIEPPTVLNYAEPKTPQADFELRPGMTLTIEPIVTMGRREVVILKDGWTVVTEDGRPAAHFRHTIAVTETGADVLTRMDAQSGL